MYLLRHVPSMNLHKIYYVLRLLLYTRMQYHLPAYYHRTYLQQYHGWTRSTYDSLFHRFQRGHETYILHRCLYNMGQHNTRFRQPLQHSRNVLHRTYYLHRTWMSQQNTWYEPCQQRIFEWYQDFHLHHNTNLALSSSLMLRSYHHFHLHAHHIFPDSCTVTNMQMFWRNQHILHNPQQECRCGYLPMHRWYLP